MHLNLVRGTKLSPLPSIDFLARRALACVSEFIDSDIHAATFGVISEAQTVYDLGEKSAADLYAEVLREVFRLKKAKDRAETTPVPIALVVERRRPPTTFSGHVARALAKLEDEAVVIEFPPSATQPLTKPGQSQGQLELF